MIARRADYLCWHQQIFSSHISEKVLLVQTIIARNADTKPAVPEDMPVANTFIGFWLSGHDPQALLVTKAAVMPASACDLFVSFVTRLH